MGEAKRKRAAEKAFEAVRAMLWTMLGDTAQRMGVERGDMLALLLEFGMLLGGFSEAESDRFIARMEDIERNLEEHERTHPPPAGSEPEGPGLPPLPGAADAQVGASRAEKRPIDPAFMEALEETGRRLTAAIGRVVEGTGLGFLVMLFGGADRSELTYLSNCDREDILSMLREFIPVLEQHLDAPPGVLSRPH